MIEARPLQNILEAMSSKNDASLALVSKAYEFAKEAHKDQKRFSGDPYFTHPADVAFLLAQAGMCPEAISAGLVHDTIEDAGTKPKAIEQEFGPEVLSLVEGVTKLGTLRYRGLERHTESLRKLFAATAKDIRVLIIKLMDRLHNARTLEHVPREEKRIRIAQETLEIYAPIADRLGMSVVKQELEDAAFPFAYPKEYEKTRELARERKNENERRLEKIEKDLKRELAGAGLREFRTEARIKGIYSLFRKLERRHWDMSKIYDIRALRLIFPTVADCYTGDGGALEMQLRTEAQHLEAQYGIASRLIYKEVQSKSAEGARGGLDWIRQFIPVWRRTSAQPHAVPDTTQSVPDWVKELARADSPESASEEYLDTLKTDFFSHRVFVFTPKGDVIDLPIAATPIDFA